MHRNSNKPTPKLRKAPQPPLSHRGRPLIQTVPGSQRWSNLPALAEIKSRRSRRRIGRFRMPTGELGTVRQVNEDDAVVKWDDDGRIRVHQPWLKRV